MDFVKHSHRHGETILLEPRYKPLWVELQNVIKGVTDEDLIKKHLSFNPKPPVSLSKAINEVLKDKLKKVDWDIESPIFQDTRFRGDRWRLDFAKDCISVEVAFNHGEAIAWNILKPVLASELNHVEKAIQTDVGVVITATAELKSKGGFDSAVGEYEKVLKYLKPFNNFLTVPMVIIGLKSPKTFYLSKTITKGKKSKTKIVKLKTRLKKN